MPVGDFGVNVVSNDRSRRPLAKTVMADKIELLFFDTFSHESSEELNLDLVQFPKPVFISEVRIIPLGARVQADFPGGVRLGATNPSQFEIEFFVNDLSKPGASTFESLGGLEYKQNGNIHLETDRRQVPTDGLVLRGWYTTITLAVYGSLTKALQDLISPPVALVPHPAPPPGPCPPDAITSTAATAEWVQQHAQVVELGGGERSRGYMVEPPSDYVGNYPSEGYTPTPEYHPPYVDHEWPPSLVEQQPQPKVEPVAWEREEDKWDPRKESRQRDYRDRSRSKEREWDYRDREWNRRPARPQRPRSPKRPHTPPAVVQDKATTPRRAEGSDPPATRVKKEASSPSPPSVAGPPLNRFGSLSPGDVESISDGEISVHAEAAVGPSTPASSPDVRPAPAPAAVSTPPPVRAESPAPAPAPARPREDVEQFEPILSDEDILDETDPQFQDLDYDFGDYEDSSKTFNPFTCEFQPLCYLPDPGIAAGAVEETRLVGAPPPAETMRLEELVARYEKGRLDSQPLQEDWVHTLEQASSLLARGLPFVSDKEGVLSTLLDWVHTGLDLETAVKQPQPGYKVRHIKAGVRLAESLCRCGPDYSHRLLEATDLHARLLALYRADYMALSIKLMILKALDVSLDSRHSVESFLGRRTNLPVNLPNGLDDRERNGYRTLIRMAQENQLARAKFAISSLLRKIHVFEVLEHLNACVKQIGEDLERAGKARTIDATPEPVSEGEAETIVACLEEVSRVYREAPVLLSQPKRFLPVCAQFEISASIHHDPYPALYAFFSTHRLLEVLLVLLSCPLTSGYSAITAPAIDILSAMLDRQSGLQFLFAHLETSSAIARLLLSSCVPEDALEEGGASSQFQQLGLSMAYRMQALQHIDSLLGLGPTDPDCAEVLEHLHGLYCLGLSPAGRSATVHVLARGGNVGALLGALAGKAPGRCYAADLLLQTVRYSDHVPFLQVHGRDVLAAGLKDVSGRLHEVVPWLRGADSPAAFSHDDVRPHCETLQRLADTAPAFPGELFTALRILRHLGVREGDLGGEGGEGYAELRHKYVILQLFSLEGVASLTAILQRLCDGYDQPSLHATSFLGSHGLQLMALVLPSVQLVRRLLTHVIRCRNARFRDLTAVPVLLRTFSLVHAFPPSAMGAPDARLAGREIVETLLAYTQPGGETDALHKSLWTLTLGEVVRHVITGPNTFIPGLLLLSELLPLPLPLQTRAPLPDAELQRTVNARRLWSAHLHCLAPALHDMMATTGGSSFQPLLQLLRRVCVQLSDLAAPSALLVARGVLDPLAGGLGARGTVCSPHAARLLNFLACLVTHPPVKAALLRLLTGGGGGKTDDRYPPLVGSLCDVLRTCSDQPPHVQAQECVVSVVQSLCDVDITLVAPPPPGPWEPYLANALPPRDLLITLCTAMLEHVANPEHSITTLLPTLRTFLMLSEHDYGFFHLKTCLDKNPTALENLFAKIYTGFSKDSSDCMTTLSISLEFLRVCITLDETLPPRTLVMSVRELAGLLGWSKREGHPIAGLETLLRECSPEEETLENLQENVSYLVRLLEEEGSKGPEPTADIPAREWTEPLLPSVEPLLAQFSARQVVVLGDAEEERLAPSFWLAPPPVDEADQDMDQVACDLMELSREFLPDLQLPSEAERLCRFRNTVPHDDTDDGDLVKKRGDDSKFLASETRNKRPFVTPMRGRGFGRAAPQRGDLFRSRPPNTSRPPSLHVDDFVALEISGQQPTGPTGYNKISMRAAKDMMSVRGRGGRGRAFPSERGRFFNPTASYRRENGRGPGRGAGGRGAPSANWADANNSQPPQQRSFRTPEHRMMPRSEEKFPRFVGGRGIRPPGWNVKDGRERFANNRGGGPRRDPSVRHARTFTR